MLIDSHALNECVLLGTVSQEFLDVFKLTAYVFICNCNATLSWLNLSGEGLELFMEDLI